MKYKKEKMIARDLGRLFGESSHTMNRWLEDVGLRDNSTKNPTQMAKNEGYSTEIWGDGFSHQAWVPERVVPRLVEYGHPLVIDLPGDLVEPVQLQGPFQSRGSSILNAEGDPVAFLSSQLNSDFTCRLLNCAFRAGTINRCFKPRLPKNGSPIM